MIGEMSFKIPPVYRDCEDCQSKTNAQQMDQTWSGKCSGECSGTNKCSNKCKKRSAEHVFAFIGAFVGPRAFPRAFPRPFLVHLLSICFTLTVLTVPVYRIRHCRTSPVVLEGFWGQVCPKIDRKPEKSEYRVADELLSDSPHSPCIPAGS